MDKNPKKSSRSKQAIQQVKPTNGHLTLQESKRTIILAWGKYSVTALCLTAITIALIQKIRF
jgi:hypothetical protein